jgi:hypothetical protein
MFTSGIALTAVTMEIMGFWGATVCSLVDVTSAHNDALD